MNRNILLPVIGITALSISGCRSTLNKDKPNIMIIIADDMGWGDIGYNNPHVYTPNLDRMAGNAALFKQQYVMPQSSPTRVALFTGRYPGRFPYYGKQATNEKCFDIGTPTLATMLKVEGYRTYLAGKWHLGSDTINGPNNHGFDSSYGSLAGAVGMYDHRYRIGQWEHTWHRDHKLIEGSENGTHATDLITQEAQNIIKKKSDKPFFLMLTFHACHTPLDERGTFTDIPTQLDPNDSTRWLHEDLIQWFNDPKGLIQSEPDPEKRLFLATVYHFDSAVGKIMKTLEAEGKLENTMILFSSDNGPQGSWGGGSFPNDLRLTDFNQPIPMRGKKLDVYEGGIHVPAFIYWKNHIVPKEITTPVHIIDWFPTLAALTGHEERASYHLDGLDLSPLLFKNRKLQDRDLYWIWNNRFNRWSLRYGDWKIVKYGVGQPQKPEDWELYNLVIDPKEENNVAAVEPEILKQLHERFLIQRAKDAPDK